MSSPVSFAQLVLVQIAQRLDLYHQGHRHPDVDMKLAKSIGWSPDKGPFQAFLAMERHHRTGKHGGRRVPPRLLMHTIKHPSYMDSIINSGQSRSQKGGRGKGMTVAASESSRSMPTATESKPSSAGTGGSGHGRVTGGAPQGGASRHRHHHHHHHHHLDMHALSDDRTDQDAQGHDDVGIYPPLAEPVLERERSMGSVQKSRKKTIPPLSPVHIPGIDDEAGAHGVPFTVNAKRQRGGGYEERRKPLGLMRRGGVRADKDDGDAGAASVAVGVDDECGEKDENAVARRSGRPLSGATMELSPDEAIAVIPPRTLPPPATPGLPPPTPSASAPPLLHKREAERVGVASKEVKYRARSRSVINLSLSSSSSSSSEPGGSRFTINASIRGEHVHFYMEQRGAAAAKRGDAKSPRRKSQTTEAFPKSTTHDLLNELVPGGVLFSGEVEVYSGGSVEGFRSGGEARRDHEDAASPKKSKAVTQESTSTLHHYTVWAHSADQHPHKTK